METIIVEDGLALVDNVGPGQYTLIMIEALTRLGFQVIVPNKKFLTKIKNKNLRRILYLVWLNTVFFYKLLFIKKGTNIIYTNYSVPFIKVNRVQTLSVVHDLCSYLFGKTMTNIQNFYSILATNNAIKNSDKVITVSYTVKDEIIRQFGCNKDKVSVVYNSNTKNMNPLEDVKEKELLNKLNISNKKYIAAVSTFNRRKNIMELIEGFYLISKDFPDIKLVLVGGKGNDDKINEIKTRNPNIIFTGYISNEELASIYKNALLFISPSIYEGFGIPVIDAQKFRIPVICSDIRIYHEIAGESAELCMPNRNGFYTSIVKLLQAADYRNSLVTKGTKNIQRFTMDVITKQLMECLKD